MNDRLNHALDDYDGKSTAIRAQIAHEFSSDDTYAADLIDIFGEGSTTVVDGATWLMKHHLEAGNSLSKQDTAALVVATNNLTSWAACLHICQSVRWLTVTSLQAPHLADWVSLLLDHKRPFLRAWSLDAMVALSQRHSILAPRAQQALMNAKDDTAASVRARVRNLENSMS